MKWKEDGGVGFGLYVVVGVGRWWGVVAVSIKALDCANVGVIDWINCVRLARLDVGGLPVYNERCAGLPCCCSFL